MANQFTQLNSHYNRIDACSQILESKRTKISFVKGAFELKGVGGTAETTADLRKTANNLSYS